jgi:hypothetical protein
MLAARPGDPLVDLGLSYVLETGVNLSPDDVMIVRSTLAKFVHGLISYQSAAAALAPMTGNTHALDRVDRVLRTPLAPLPSPSMPPSDSRSRAKTRPWSAYEDQRLIAGLHHLGTSEWPAIAAFVGNNRTKSQCHQRWTRGLDPSINKAKWTPEQDAQLLSLVTIHGQKAWSRISAEIGSRCDVQCRYRYGQLAKDPKFPDMEAKAAAAAEAAPMRPFQKMNRYGPMAFWVPPPMKFVPVGYMPQQIVLPMSRQPLMPIPMLPLAASRPMVYQNQPMFPPLAPVVAAPLPRQRKN